MGEKKKKSPGIIVETEKVIENHGVHKVERSSGGLRLKPGRKVSVDLLCLPLSQNSSKQAACVCLCWCMAAWGYSDVCVRMFKRPPKAWKFTEEIVLWGATLYAVLPPFTANRSVAGESGVFSAFHPSLQHRKETLAGNVDNSAVIAGDL